MRRARTDFLVVVVAGVVASGAAMGEVSVKVDDSSRSAWVLVTPVQTGSGVRIWEPAGVAAIGSHVLNPNGDLRGDGRPDFAYSPLTGLPTAVWAARNGKSTDIVSSTFDGSAWSAPALVPPSGGGEDLDPRIVFTPDGTAIVTWWTKSPVPTVRLATASPGGSWTAAGNVSLDGERASQPAIRQESDLTIIAYRTPKGLRIVTRRLVRPDFGDGPTPFPRDGGPRTDDPPPATP